MAPSLRYSLSAWRWEGAREDVSRFAGAAYSAKRINRNIPRVPSVASSDSTDEKGKILNDGEKSMCATCK